MCAAIDAEDEHSKPTCACWVGERANCFAVGYDDGSILVWGVPPMALQGEGYLWAGCYGLLAGCAACCWAAAQNPGPGPGTNFELPIGYVFF